MAIASIATTFPSRSAIRTSSPVTTSCMAVVRQRSSSRAVELLRSEPVDEHADASTATASRAAANRIWVTMPFASGEDRALAYSGV